jgi:hypothetical protein
VNEDRQSGLEREEAPFISSSIARIVRATTYIVREALLKLGPRIQLALWWGGAAAVLILIPILAIIQQPNLEGIAKGIFAGIFSALLYAVAAGWTFLWLNKKPRPETPDASPSAGFIDRELEPALRERSSTRSRA